MSETKGFAKLFRFCDTIAEYEAAKTDGTVNDDVFVIIIQDKVAKFKGETFNLAGGGGGDMSDKLIEVEEVSARSLNAINSRQLVFEKNVEANYLKSSELNKHIQDIMSIIIENEETTAAAIVSLHEKIKNV